MKRPVRRPARRPLRTLESLECRRLLATIVVTSAGDTSARDNVLTLREAIEIANGTLAPATLDAGEAASVTGTVNTGPTNRDVIEFNIPGAGVQVIAISGNLPTISDPVEINGYSQSDAAPNTLDVGSDAVLRIELDLSGRGIVLAGGDSLVRGLAIGTSSSDPGVDIQSDRNIIEGNHIGVDATGTQSRENPLIQVWVKTGADNLIGGITPAARNVIAGGFSNAAGMITLGGVPFGAFPIPPSNTFIRGNYIGTNAAGTAALGNGGEFGIFIREALGTVIGGDDAADGSVDGRSRAGNLLAGIRNEAISISSSLASQNGKFDGVTIQGNTIGLDSTGNTALAGGIGIGTNGARVEQGLIQIGGTTVGAGNVISGHSNYGLLVNGVIVHIEGNRIGTNVDGTASIPNLVAGISVQVGGTGTPNTDYRIGGPTPGARNLISGNGTSQFAADGIEVSGITSGLIFIQGNWIGVAADGVSPLPNTGNGVDVVNRPALVGGVEPGEGNLIAFNTRSGVLVSGANVTTVLSAILGNSIHDNGGLGIDLGGFDGGQGAGQGNGVTLNDLGTPPDQDNGPNDFQNYPVITNAVVASQAPNFLHSVDFTLNSTPNTSFRVEFFGNAVADPSAHGEGQVFLGSVEVTTDANGNLTSTQNSFAALARYNTVSATATALRNTVGSVGVAETSPGQYGGTSEFSATTSFNLIEPAGSDLSINATATPVNVTPGQEVTYTFTLISPPDSSNASNVALTIALPPGTGFRSFTAPAGFTSTTPAVDGTGNVTSSTPTLNFGANYVFTLVVQVDPEAANGTQLSASASLTSDTTDPDPGNNSATTTATVAIEGEPTADLSILTLTDTPDPVIAGQSLTYQITILNNGPSTATNVVLTDLLPANVAFLSTTAGSFDPELNQVVAHLGSLASGQQVSVTIVVQPTLAAAGSAIINTASVSAAQSDPNTSNNQQQTLSTQVLIPPDDLIAPAIATVARYGFHTQPTYLVVNFSEPMDPATASDPGRYIVFGRGPDHRLGTADDTRFLPANVVYDAQNQRAIIRFTQRLSVFRTYRLVLDASSPSALRDLAGNLLDGDNNGQPGGDAHIAVNRRLLAGPARNVPKPAMPMPESLTTLTAPGGPSALIRPRKAKRT